MATAQEIVEAFLAMDEKQRAQVLTCLSPKASSDKIIGALKEQMAEVENGFNAVRNHITTLIQKADGGDLAIVPATDAELTALFLGE